MGGFTIFFINGISTSILFSRLSQKHLYMGIQIAEERLQVCFSILIVNAISVKLDCQSMTAMSLIYYVLKSFPNTHFIILFCLFLLFFKPMLPGRILCFVLDKIHADQCLPLRLCAND